MNAPGDGARPEQAVVTALHRPLAACAVIEDGADTVDDDTLYQLSHRAEMVIAGTIRQSLRRADDQIGALAGKSRWARDQAGIASGCSGSSSTTSTVAFSVCAPETRMTPLTGATST